MSPELAAVTMRLDILLKQALIHAARNPLNPNQAFLQYVWRNHEAANIPEELAMRAQNWTQSEGGDRVRDWVTNHTPAADSDWQIERVARTEALRWVNEATYDAAWNEGQLLTWHAVMDDRVRPDHAELNGVTILVGDTFQLADGSFARFPGDWTLPLEQCVNCRCTISRS